MISYEYSKSDGKMKKGECIKRNSQACITNNGLYCSKYKTDQEEFEMKKTIMVKKVVAAVLVISMIVPNCVGTYAASKEDVNKKEYIVTLKNESAYDEFNKENAIINSEYTKYMNEENFSVNTLSASQVEGLEKKQEIIGIEENVKVSGSGKEEINPNKISEDWNIKMINADKGDKKNKLNTDRIKIAIIDSGIDETGDILVKKRCNLVPGDEEILPCYEDNTGHGTSIAGIIDQITEKKTDIYSIKVMDTDNTAPLSRIIEAIYRAIEYDVNIINMSFGTTYDSVALHKAIKEAKNQGILLIAAAGNRGESDAKVEYPAAYEEVMSVGAVNANAEVTEESSKGDVDVYAPGELVRTLTSLGLETASSGTSMAAPHVSAAAAILWGKDKSKSPEFIRELLEQSSNEIEDNGEKYRLIDTEYALEVYDEYDEKFDNEKYAVKKNNNEIEKDDDTIKVTARWSKNNHEALVTNNKKGTLTTAQLKIIRAGIRYNDAVLAGSTKTAETQKYKRNIWHSLTRKTNYMAAVNLVGRVIGKAQCSTDVDFNANGVINFTNDQINTIKSDINNITKAKLLKTGIYSETSTDYKNLKMTATTKRFLLLGMELHIITDAFAHRSYGILPYMSGKNQEDWIRVETDKDKNLNADDINYYPSRYKAAGITVKNVMNQCLKIESGEVKIMKTELITCKQIVDNNDFISSVSTPNDRFILYRLFSYSASNVNNDSNFITYSNRLEERSCEWDFPTN